MIPTDVLDIVRGKLSDSEYQRSDIYWHKGKFERGQNLKIGPLDWVMPFDAVLVFVDLAPKANWAHPCLYVFIELHLSEVRILKSSFPPPAPDWPGSYALLSKKGEPLQDH